jgi:hypothetical protein
MRQLMTGFSAKFFTLGVVVPAADVSAETLVVFLLGHSALVAAPSAADEDVFQQGVIDQVGGR